MPTDEDRNAAIAEEAERRVAAMRTRRELMEASRARSRAHVAKEAAVRAEVDRLLSMPVQPADASSADPTAQITAAEIEEARQAQAAHAATVQTTADRAAKAKAAFKRGMAEERENANAGQSASPHGRPDIRSAWRNAMKRDSPEDTSATTTARDRHGLDPRLAPLKPDSPFGP